MRVFSFLGEQSPWGHFNDQNPGEVETEIEGGGCVLTFRESELVTRSNERPCLSVVLRVQTPLQANEYISTSCSGRDGRHH